MSTAPARRLLGTAHGIAERVRVYRTAEALEIDQTEQLNIRRQRVFFDEVQLVTLHRRLELPVEAVFWGVVALIGGLAAAGTAASGSRMFLILFTLAGALALGRMMSLLLPVWTVTVFGKRTRARLRFRLRRGKAHRVYDEICRTVAEAQEEAALRFAAQAPKPPPLPAPAQEVP